MSFNIALSGLQASSQDLSVISNNIANASTIGFKKSRAEFGDVYQTSGSGSAVGSGVQNLSVSQDFGQGPQKNTGRNLDLRINGEGFFRYE
ncbi:hypothetical protein AVM71_09705 [Piscirickettsia salmonis]|nr:hypothetical protein AVM71_09705 [Piscirickettsia salmonis]